MEHINNETDPEVVVKKKDVDMRSPERFCCLPSGADVVPILSELVSGVVLAGGTYLGTTRPAGAC